MSATSPLALNKVPRKVSFVLPSNHKDKYSEAYRQLTPAQLKLAWEHTHWKQLPVSKKWLERSSSKVWAETLHNNKFEHNSRFSILAVKDDGDDNGDNETTATNINIALPVLDQATGKRWNMDSSANTQSIKMCGTNHTLTN
jgi:hypothetical protein